MFPAVGKPEKIYYPLEPDVEDLYDDTIKILAPKPGQAGLTYNRYMAIMYLIPEKKTEYKSADVISAHLKAIMKTLLLKRLDSSFHAFEQSIRGSWTRPR